MLDSVLSTINMIPRNRFNFRLLFMSAVYLLDDAILVTLGIIILSRLGFHTPVWLIILVAILFAAWIIISYFVMMKNPQLGFENMIGNTGLTLDSLGPRGTVRIGHERWAAKARGGNIETGVAIVVVGQNGLLLTVVRENQKERTSSFRN